MTRSKAMWAPDTPKPLVVNLIAPVQCAIQCPGAFFREENATWEDINPQEIDTGDIIRFKPVGSNDNTGFFRAAARSTRLQSGEWIINAEAWDTEFGLLMETIGGQGHSL